MDPENEVRSLSPKPVVDQEWNDKLYLNLPLDLSGKLLDACVHMAEGEQIQAGGRTVTVKKAIENNPQGYPVNGVVQIASNGHNIEVHIINGIQYYYLDGQESGFIHGQDDDAESAWNKVIFETVKGLEATKQQNSSADSQAFQDRIRENNARRIKTLMDM